VWIAVNPWLWRKEGWTGLVRTSRETMLSNETNHFSNRLPGIGEKLDMLDGHWMNGTELALIIALCVWGIARMPARRRGMPAALLAGSLPVFFYYLFFINKAWAHYYLPIFIMLPLALALCLPSLPLARMTNLLRHPRIADSATLTAGVLALLLAFVTPAARFLNAFPEEHLLREQASRLEHEIAPFMGRMGEADFIFLPEGRPLRYYLLGLEPYQVQYLGHFQAGPELARARMVVVPTNLSPGSAESRAIVDWLERVKRGQTAFLVCPDIKSSLVLCRKDLLEPERGT
jgi:hypothetical protein